MRQDQASTGPSQRKPPKPPLDTVVKMALGVLFGSFALIWGGMFLSRPDRSIPPYSVGSQLGIHVAVHVPPATSDTEIETLIARFRKVGHETRNFGPMKIRPTTPEDPAGQYRRVIIYIFTHEAWTEPEVLQKYVVEQDQAIQEGFDKALRGLYRLEGSEEEGRIGPLLRGKESPATAAYSRELFRGPVTTTVVPAPSESTPAP